MMKISELARRLQISTRMAYGLVARGEIAHYKVGSLKRISEEDLQQYLDRQRAETNRAAKPSGRHF